MSICIETERLVLKPMRRSDAPGLFELYNDADVMRFTGDVPFKNVAEAEEFIRQYSQTYQNYSRGRLSTFIKDTGEYIGWCGLKYLSAKDETDIGYRFLKYHRGKGYATESAKACLADGFTRLQLTQILGTAMKDNAASINVFRKLGLRYINDENCGWQPGVVYAITKQEWELSQAKK